MTANQQRPELYLSMPHPCSYLPERTSTILFVDPRYSSDSAFYGQRVQQGFRRSGDLIYRPYCRGCNACVPVRVPAARFRPDRGQRRVWERNRDLTVRERPPGFDPAQFELYRDYQTLRHPGSSMDDSDPEKYLAFLLSRRVETRFYEFRLGADDSRLLAVAVADRLPDGLSAMYTFFDPRQRSRALGVYAILWEIEQVRRLGLAHLYLGYWIRECPKMSYKNRYRPVEALRNGRWVEL
jgi:arginine-tRNA-protein transferase